MINKIKSILNKNKKNIFESYYLEFNFTDGSFIKTDVMLYKDFKKMVDDEIKGTEFRTPTQDDYKEELENIIFLTKNINESNYFKVIIEGKHRTFLPENIVNVKVNIKGKK